jgi:hypothetical protein
MRARAGAKVAPQEVADAATFAGGSQATAN